jgi:hypothetical protein
MRVLKRTSLFLETVASFRAGGPHFFAGARATGGRIEAAGGSAGVALMADVGNVAAVLLEARGGLLEKSGLFACRERGWSKPIIHRAGTIAVLY